jgi:hypothetical protein
VVDVELALVLLAAMSGGSMTTGPDATSPAITLAMPFTWITLGALALPLLAVAVVAGYLRQRSALDRARVRVVLSERRR